MATGSLGRAVLEYSADTAKFEQDVGRAAAMFNRSVSDMRRTAEGLRDAFLAVAAVGGIGMMIKSAIDAGDQLGKLSQKVGISVEALSGLKLGAELADVSLESFARGMKGFNSAMAEAADTGSKSAATFAALGVDLTKGPEAALRQTAAAFSKMEDGAVKSTLAVQLFGKAGMDMIPFLNAGAQGMDKAAQQAKAFGLTIGDDFAKKSEQFNDNMKLIGKGAQAMGLAIAEHAIGALATMTTNIVKAAEAGEYWTGVMREAVKLALAIAGGMGRMPGMGILGLADKQIGAAFGGLMTPEQKGAVGLDGLLGRINGNNKDTAAPNPEQLACVVSGGKWVNGACQRGGAGKPDDTAKRIRESEEAGMAGRAQIAEQFYFDMGQLDKKALEEHLARLAKATSEEEAAYIARTDAIEKAYIDQGQIELKKMKDLAKQTEQTDSISKQLGLTMSSAFEHAIIKGEELRDVVKGLAQDILQIALRKAVTEPIGQGVSNAITSSGALKGVGDWFSGLFKAEGGPVMGGSSYIVGENGPEMFTPGLSGTVTPNSALGGATYYIDAKGADPAAIGRLERVITQLNGSIERRALNVVASEAQRGGSFAAALGK